MTSFSTRNCSTFLKVRLKLDNKEVDYDEFVKMVNQKKV